MSNSAPAATIDRLVRPVAKQIFFALQTERDPRGLLIAFFGHHKCASTWAGGILWDAARTLGLRCMSVNFSRSYAHGLGSAVSQHHAEVLTISNADSEAIKDLPPFRGFHLIRDPRDICVSAYHSHLKSHATGDDWSELPAIRERLNSLSFDDGLAWEIEYLGEQFADMEAWDYGQPNIHELRFEEAVSDPMETMVSILEWLGLAEPEGTERSIVHEALADARRALVIGVRRHLPIRTKVKLTHPRSVSLVWRHRFENFAEGRRRGQEDLSSHYRKGVSGEWCDAFSANHRILFQSRYPTLLKSLGYEADASWCDTT